METQIEVYEAVKKAHTKFLVELMKIRHSEACMKGLEPFVEDIEDISMDLLAPLHAQAESLDNGIDY